MESQGLREKFLKFFEERKHTIVPSSSLLPADPSVLFTTAGMQQFKEYYLGKPSPYGNRVASCQKCFRTSDIDQVGDETHLTFLEMLGNFSFNNEYFKKKAIELALEFLIKDCKLEIEKLWITIFKGEQKISEDKESKEIWENLGIKKERIFGFGKKDNFWGPTGKEGPCGPTTEIHYQLKEKPCQKGEKCIPNCECGRFIEIWNLVFNQYYCDAKGNLTPLKKKGIDTGMGLERLAMVVQKKSSVFGIDLFEPLIEEINLRQKTKSEKLQLETKNFQRHKRIIADHIKGITFLIADGVFPSNVEQGYILRRILRRSIRFARLLELPSDFLIFLAKKVIEIYKEIYPELLNKQSEILTIIQNEKERFERTLKIGLKQFYKIAEKGNISGKDAFHLYDTYGFPLEMIEELAKEKGILVDKEGFKESFKRHQKISKKGAERKFGGIGIEKLKDEKEKLKATKLHTATHLLHSALREILGSHIKQMGSDITPQRLRFDFSHPEKLTKEELKRTEDLVNQKIKEDLKVRKEKMDYQKAIEKGALAFFKEKYPQKVNVYFIGEEGREFSKEICQGPHVERTGKLGIFKIIKEESCGAGIRRIKAILV